jgi:hypothetical protein
MKDKFYDKLHMVIDRVSFQIVFKKIKWKFCNGITQSGKLQ